MIWALEVAFSYFFSLYVGQQDMLTFAHTFVFVFSWFWKGFEKPSKPRMMGISLTAASWTLLGMLLFKGGAQQTVSEDFMCIGEVALKVTFPKVFRI